MRGGFAAPWSVTTRIFCPELVFLFFVVFLALFCTFLLSLPTKKIYYVQDMGSTKKRAREANPLRSAQIVN